jgi:hypothetical protein
MVQITLGGSNLIQKDVFEKQVVTAYLQWNRFSVDVSQGKSASLRLWKV